MAVPSPALATWSNACEILEEREAYLRPVLLLHQAKLYAEAFPANDQLNLLVDLLIWESSGVTDRDLWHLLGILVGESNKLLLKQSTLGTLPFLLLLLYNKSLTCTGTWSTRVKQTYCESWSSAVAGCRVMKISHGEDLQVDEVETQDVTGQRLEERSRVRQ